LVLLYNGLGKRSGSVKEEEQGCQNKPHLPVHPTVSTHLEPRIFRIQAAGPELVGHR